MLLCYNADEMSWEFYTCLYHLACGKIGFLLCHITLSTEHINDVKKDLLYAPRGLRYILFIHHCNPVAWHTDNWDEGLTLIIVISSSQFCS